MSEARKIRFIDKFTGKIYSVDIGNSFRGVSSDRDQDIAGNDVYLRSDKCTCDISLCANVTNDNRIWITITPKDLMDMVESGILTHPENIQDPLKEFTYLFDPNDLSKVLEARRTGVKFLKPFVISDQSNR